MLIDGVPMECITQASVQYHVPAVVIVAVLKTENGYVGCAKLNRNGTVDYGPMQINSSWLNELHKYGYSAADLQYDPCLNVSAGSWILAREIAREKNIWRGVGNYHSHSYAENLTYQYKVDYVLLHMFGKILMYNY
jgi:hypothetical protein